jgi:hypothetical protein
LRGVPVDPVSPDWTWTEQFALMFRDTAKALVEADPVGLIATGAPSDEYDAEAAQIVGLTLADAASREDVLRLAGDVFAHYFGDRNEDRLGAFVDAVWRRYLELQEDT